MILATLKYFGPSGKLHFFNLFPQHLCYGSPFLPSLSVPWLGAGNPKFDPPSENRAPFVIVIVVVVVLYLG